MFDVSFQYTYLKTNYKNYIDFIPTPTGLERADLSDSRFPNAPKHQLTITPKITLPVPEAWGTISALANFYYQSSVAFDPANRINGIAQRGTTVDGYGKLDLRMDWRNIAGSNFSLAAYARNVTNKKYVTGSANQLSSRSEEHTSELQSLMRISYAVFCLKQKKKDRLNTHHPSKTRQPNHQLTQQTHTIP